MQLIQRVAGMQLIGTVSSHRPAGRWVSRGKFLGLAWGPSWRDVAVCFLSPGYLHGLMAVAQNPDIRVSQRYTQSDVWMLSSQRIMNLTAINPGDS